MIHKNAADSGFQHSRRQVSIDWGSRGSVLLTAGIMRPVLPFAEKMPEEATVCSPPASVTETYTAINAAGAKKEHEGCSARRDKKVTDQQEPCNPKQQIVVSNAVND